jgi:spore maturation protein CgeB
MHVSDFPFESGNMRTYETPAHGMLMISDKGGGHGHAQIFAPDCEAIYYDSSIQAIELIEHYLVNEDERVRIAKAGFDRYWRDYQWEENLLRFLDWAGGLQRNEVLGA